MQGEIVITIPGVPAAKGRPRIGKLRNGRPVAITPEKTRTREGVVASLAMDAMRGRPPVEGPLAVTVFATMPMPATGWSKAKRAAAMAGKLFPTGRPDLDNLVKLVTDACNGIVWGDDSQIVKLTARKVYGPVPQTMVFVGGAS